MQGYVESLSEFWELAETLSGHKQISTPTYDWSKLIIETAVEADTAIRQINPYSGEPADQVSVATKLAEVLYAVFGSARRFDIPIDAVFEALHTHHMDGLHDFSDRKDDPTEAIRSVLVAHAETHPR